jgi:hypothetical protein
MPTLAPTPPLLTQEDLDDPERFVTLPGVPLLDVHDHPAKGDVTLGMLRAHCTNMARQAAEGQFPAVTLGHLRPKQTREVEKGGVKVRVLGHAEHEQPRIVGYASRGRLGRYLGRPCLFGDLHYHRHLYDEAAENPFVSVERLEPGEDEGDGDGDGKPAGDVAPDDPAHRIDRVALLRTPPERPLGIIRYEADCATDSEARAEAEAGRALRRVAYAGDFTRLPVAPLHEPEPPAPAAGSATTPPPDPEDPDMPAEVTAPAADDQPLTMGAFRSMLPEITAAIRESLLSPEGLPPGEHDDETAPQYYADDDEIPADPAEEMEQPPAAAEEEVEPGSSRVPYGGAGCSEPGPGNVFTPTNGEPPPKKKEKKDMVDRVEYARMERRVGESEEMIAYLFSQLEQERLDKRRLAYEASMKDLIDNDGRAIDVAEELAELTEAASRLKPEELDAWQERRLARMQKYERRADYGRNHRLPVAPASPGAVAPGVIANKDQMREVVDLAMRKGISIPDAKKELGI